MPFPGSRLRDLGARILLSQLGDDVVEVLLAAKALALEQFDNSADLPHVRDGGFFEDMVSRLGARVAHGLPLHCWPHATSQSA